jgi:hypothetical protein
MHHIDSPLVTSWPSHAGLVAVAWVEPASQALTLRMLSAADGTAVTEVRQIVAGGATGVAAVSAFPLKAGSFRCVCMFVRRGIGCEACSIAPGALINQIQ